MTSAHSHHLPFWPPTLRNHTFQHSEHRVFRAEHIRDWHVTVIAIFRHIDESFVSRLRHQQRIPMFSLFEREIIIEDGLRVDWVEETILFNDAVSNLVFGKDELEGFPVE